MCDVCASFLHLLVSYENRFNVNDSDHPVCLTKRETEIVLNYVQTWPNRQCMCCYRDIKNFDRFNLVIQSIIFFTVHQLKNVKRLLNANKLIQNHKIQRDRDKSSVLPQDNEDGDPGSSTASDKIVSSAIDCQSTTKMVVGVSSEDKKEPTVVAEEQQPDESSNVTPNQMEDEKSEEDVVEQQNNYPNEEIWTISDLEKLLLLLSKIFLLNFPLYVAYKHGIHARMDEIMPQEAQALSLFCDLHDNEIPAFLLRNVSLFCTTAGFEAMTLCFDEPNFPPSTAHAITALISNIKLWFNCRSSNSMFMPLRGKILRWMCNLSDQELRQPPTKAMADFLWTCARDPLDANITFDEDGLALAFKYFQLSTLTMRLAGLVQINCQINSFNDICTTETVAEVELVGQKLADWLSENQIMQHLFGPNLHVEVIKQSHVVLNFLAVENQISEEHITLMWQAAQLKHCSKQIFDLLPPLVKNLAPRPAAHLYQLLCRLDPKEHSEQSIYVASALIKLIWARETSRVTLMDIAKNNILRETAELPSSSENSASVDNSNSDDEQPDDDSSDNTEMHKSLMEGDMESDSGAPPCKQARHKNCCDETTDDSIKVEPDIYDVDHHRIKDKMIPLVARSLAAFNEEATSSEDCLDVNETYAVRKKLRKKRKKMTGLTRKEMQELAESVSDVDESHSDCSDGNLQASVLSHLHHGGEVPYIAGMTEGHLINFLNAADNDGSCSSPMSNKSEKNMADFDDEDSPSVEELADLALTRAHCMQEFSIPRSTNGTRQRSTTPNNLSSTNNKVSTPNSSTTTSSGSRSTKATPRSAKDTSSTSQNTIPSACRFSDVCNPGQTLLWDLLQDDKICYLSEAVVSEAEKVISTLLCFNTDKIIRTRFIEGCLQNLADNKSVVVSLRLLPKLFASFQQFRDVSTHQVTMWAERHHRMMFHFFNNLNHYTHMVRNLSKDSNVNSALNMYSHITQIQVRLQFLSSVFSDLGTPRNFKLTLNQVDSLWSCLANDAECSDCLFAWLQNQVKGGEHHALGLNAIQHLYLKRLHELKPEGISMVALGLFQQLFVLGRSEVINKPNEGSTEIVGMGSLWKIALRATNTEVSLTAIQYINTFYMDKQLKYESQFVSQCMNHLKQAADDINNQENQENALMCVQRALMLLNTHLETFRRRYAYHLRRWALEGQEIGIYGALRVEVPGPILRIILQPGGGTEKSILQLHGSDLVADLKAEIAKWWETLQGNAKTPGTSAPVLGLLLSEGPLRIITQGQEITSEYDERSLVDVGFKDNQMVYVSLGGRGGRRREQSDHPSQQPPPPKDCLPTLLLLKSPYFEQLFSLMQTLGDMKMPAKGGLQQPHTKAQLLSRRVWEILAMLPTCPSFLNVLKNLSFDKKILNPEDNENTKEMSLQEILEPKNLQKFMYALHIVESLCKSKFTGNSCCGTGSGNITTISNSASSSNNNGTSGGNHSKNSSLSVKNQLKLKLSSSKSLKLQNQRPKQTCASKKSKAEEEKSSSSENENKENKVEKESEEKIEEIHNPSQVEEELKPVPEITKEEREKNASVEWNDLFIKCGGLAHLYDIFLSGVLQKVDKNDAEDLNEWRHDCLACLLRILCLLGVDDLKTDENQIIIPKLNHHTLSLFDPRLTLERIASILNEESLPINPNQFKTGLFGRASVIHFAMNLLVCFAHSSHEVREILWKIQTNSLWLQRIILDDPEPTVRREACAALYRLCLGNSKTYNELLAPLLSKLVSLLPLAEKMRPANQNFQLSPQDDGKEPYGPACRDYFWLLCRLVDALTPDLIKESLDESISHRESIYLEAMCQQVAKSILDRDILETRHGTDDGLFGLLNLMGNLLKYDPPFKFSDAGQEFINNIFECLFELPSPERRDKPKCKSHGARAAAYDLLVEMCKNAPKNYLLLHGKLISQHRPGPHSPYPWDYWPRDEGRSECGYVGLTNLGATCYMASCIQHLFMLRQTRDAILSAPPDAPQKHKATLCELQRMFAYLMESERKSYNPRSFCRVYHMDHQPLNTGEQKDMAEFFIDLVSKLEEITPELKQLVKRIFCGVLSNNVVSLDCGHVSRTLEEFYTVRCQVADMRNLEESLDEVTVKDTLEGDNMYTCSQCGRKVRAEKRACFKKLPQVLCFNTMRYTFNMVTMLKEKVNTHFSFPMRLDMKDYVEKTLMPQHYEEEKRKSQLRRSNSRNVSECEPSPSTSAEIIEEKKDSPSNDDGDIQKEQQELDEEESEDFNENYEYDLVGVTVHTGTADGGHYYSFIKERNENSNGQDRWFLFNDAEVKVFDPSQIAAECFGGEMTSKTYDSVTEKYLDFSFEKTNSAYMLFYEWRSNKGTNGQRDRDAEEASSSTSNATDHLGSAKDTDALLKEVSSTLLKCDILDIKSSQPAQASPVTPIQSSSLVNPVPVALQPSTSTLKSSLLSKDLEDWIWQDNRHFLQDRNIFEHTYFNFMWQICGHIPQTLISLPEITCIAAQLSVSFFIETFIHAKEKPTMVLWVELLTKQFNASQEACEWFLSHMSAEPWWPVQVLIQCPNTMVRQMFQRLVIHVIQRLRSSHSNLYLKVETDEEGNEVIGNVSCVTRFIKSLILLMEHGAKAHLRHLSEFFGLLFEFSRMGEEETLFLLKINVIRSVADFYLGHKAQDCIDTSSDNEENSSDEALAIDKTRPASLDKMIALVASLVERSRGPDLRLHLSARDYNAIAGGKGFPFLYQQIKDNINPHQTRHLIHALCRCDERLAGQIIAMLFTAVTKHTELCGPFFKLLTLLTESTSGPSGLPCFSQLVLQRVWEAAEYCPQSALEWLALQAPRNKIAHTWILQSAESWVEQFLLAHNNARVRNAAANLIVALVPSQSFRNNFRSVSHHKFSLHAFQHRELSGETSVVLHTVLNLLLRLLRPSKNYTDIAVHGTNKLTAYFNLMTYCLVSKAEKLMVGNHIRALWELFHPRLSEPSVPAHHNKQALLAFWHQATLDCPENASLVANSLDITRNIAFNYILADHDDAEIIAYNRAMLPVYYGLLRLCCQQSRMLTRQLAAHQNLQWAFKNITPHPTQYPLAVDELFRLMTLFAARHPDASEAEIREVSIFRRTTMTAYLNGLDARVSWGTLIAALRILVDNDDDRLFVVLNGGITLCFDALHTLHAMYHEATACHVFGDLQELLTELLLLITTLRSNYREQKKRPPPTLLKGFIDAARRLVTLLNTFNPPEMRNLALEVLKELLKCAPPDAIINAILPILTHCHSPPTPSNSLNAMGSYFPRRGMKSTWPAVSKNTPRPPRPMVQMCIPQSQICEKGLDKDFDAALEAFYKPYHDFLDVLFRVAVTANQLNDAIVHLSCITGIEAVVLHFNIFAKFWVGIFNNKTTNKYSDMLVKNPLLVDYIEMILRDERLSLNDPIIANFVEIYYTKVKTNLAVSKLIESICNLLKDKVNLEDICGDLQAIRIIGQRSGIKNSVKLTLQECLQSILLKFKDECLSEEESPPKKRRMSTKSDEEKTKIDKDVKTTILDRCDDKVIEKCDEKQITDAKEKCKDVDDDIDNAGDKQDSKLKEENDEKMIMDDKSVNVDACEEKPAAEVKVGTEATKNESAQSESSKAVPSNHDEFYDATTTYFTTPPTPFEEIGSDKKNNNSSISGISGSNNKSTSSNSNSNSAIDSNSTSRKRATPNNSTSSDDPAPSTSIKPVTERDFRKSLIKDIESQIEIIFECLDDDEVEEEEEIDDDDDEEAVKTSANMK